MKHIMLRAIFQFFLNAEFVVGSINISPTQWCGNDFWTGGAENIKYKFRFAPKLPSIGINQNVQ